tara:strand:- start:278 stop:670 length:393 start_codon:yes stop_codon:yes gene_type:complete
MSSIFSKIINKEIPAYIVSEDKDNIAFMDIFPIQRGHVLVVPKIEVDNIFDLTLESYLSLFSFAKKVSKSIQKIIPCNRIGVSVIGLEVPHAHIHLVPINTLDDMDFKRKKNISKMELLKLAEKISKEIK